MLTQLLITGISVGCIYGLVALGLVMTYKATELVNFAQGELVMLGAFTAYTFIEIAGLGFIWGVVLTLVVSFVIGAGLDRFIFRKIIGQPQFAVIMLTVGLGVVIRAIVSMVPAWGVLTRSFHVPYSGMSFTFNGVFVTMEHIVIVACTIAICIALVIFFRYTRLGKSMQAASQNQLAAYCMGIPVTSIFSIVFGISAVLAAAGGILLSPITFVDVNMGRIVLVAFPAAILGGFKSPVGAIVGGMIIGIVEQMSGFWISHSAKNVAPYVLLLAVLTVRPEGLFGQRISKKV